MFEYVESLEDHPNELNLLTLKKLSFELFRTKFQSSLINFHDNQRKLFSSLFT